MRPGEEIAGPTPVCNYSLAASAPRRGRVQSAGDRENVSQVFPRSAPHNKLDCINQICHLLIENTSLSFEFIFICIFLGGLFLAAVIPAVLLQSIDI